MKILVAKPFPPLVWTDKKSYYGGWPGEVMDFPESLCDFLLKRGFAVEAKRRI